MQRPGAQSNSTPVPVMALGVAASSLSETLTPNGSGLRQVAVCTKCPNMPAAGIWPSLDQRGRVAPDHDVGHRTNGGRMAILLGPGPRDAVGKLSGSCAEIH